MDVTIHNLDPSEKRYYVRHTSNDEGKCVLEIDYGQHDDAMNLEPHHRYVVTHLSLETGGCMLSVVQSPMTSAMKSAAVAVAAAAVPIRQCSCCGQTKNCPAPSQPACDAAGDLTCSQAI